MGQAFTVRDPNPTPAATPSARRNAWLLPRTSKQPPVLSLGTMNFGRRTPIKEAEILVQKAYDNGIRLFDTANVYNDGEAERILGKAIAPIRANALIATKVGLARTKGQPEGLSRVVVKSAAEASLKRLGTDFVDILYLHAPDYNTAIEETLSAVRGLLESGKIRAWGVSNYASWQIHEFFQICDLFGMSRPAISQVIFNPLVRQIELEYTRFAQRFGLHTTVYNPLAGGLLVGDRHRVTPTSGSRFDGNPMYQRRYLSEPMAKMVDQLAEIARDERISLVKLSYSWIASRPYVDSILLGPATVAHLDDAIEAVGYSLSDEAKKRVDAVYKAYVGTDVSYAR